MNEETNLLFVYGSLLSGFHHPAYDYLSKYFNLIGEAKVKGQLFDMGEYPVALPTQDDKYLVGELYAINNPAEFSYAISQLDDYEGLYVEAGEVALYKRETTTAIHGNQLYTAWVYWFNGSTGGLPEIAGGNLLTYLQQKNQL